jgi:cytochrome c-type biogenesis protein CcmE
MKLGWVLSAAATIAGIGAMMAAFLTNSSPYVDVAKARSMSGDNLHLAGDMNKETLFADVQKQEVRFMLTDEKGAQVRVIYQGAPPTNMGSATKVVAVGKLRGDTFHARKLLLKCPSKYESDAKAGQGI